MILYCIFCTLLYSIIVYYSSPAAAFGFLVSGQFGSHVQTL